MKEEEKINELFENLKDTFDTEEPQGGHQLRFLEKLQTSQGVVPIKKKKNSWWKPLSIAASVVVLLGIGFSLYNSTPTRQAQLAKISPEASNTELYFANLIEEQVKELEDESTPETKKIIDDTMVQLKKLETSYKMLEQDLLNGGNGKLILSAMITNFQTRIDLLRDVLDQVENIKKLKNYNDENYTI